MLTQDIKAQQKEDVSSGNGDNFLGSRFLRWRKGDTPSFKVTESAAIPGFNFWPPFELREDLSIWMYCTCAPCGDASMELCIAAQEDATPWELSSPNPSVPTNEDDPTKRLLDGRAYFSILGVVRRKPSRADAEPTLSKSCSDKIALKQVTSILSLPTSLLVAPTKSAYINNFLLPEEEISRVACDRCFGSGETGRFKPLRSRKWGDDSATGVEYTYRPFSVRSLPTGRFESLWEYRKSKDPAKAKNYKPGNISAIWTAAPSHSVKSEIKGSTNLTETILNGVKQGHHITSPSGRKASALSRARMWELLWEVVQLSPSTTSKACNVVATGEGDRGENLATNDGETPKNDFFRQILLSCDTYASVKQRSLVNPATRTRKQVLADVQDVLGNWIPNHGDENWSLDVLKENLPKARTRAAHK